MRYWAFVAVVVLTLIGGASCGGGGSDEEKSPTATAAASTVATSGVTESPTPGLTPPPITTPTAYAEQQIRAVIQKFFDALNNRDATLAASYCWPDFAAQAKSDWETTFEEMEKTGLRLVILDIGAMEQRGSLVIVPVTRTLQGGDIGTRVYRLLEDEGKWLIVQVEPWPPGVPTPTPLAR